MALGVCISSWIQHPNPVTDLFGGMLVWDRYALFFDIGSWLTRRRPCCRALGHGQLVHR